MREHIEHLLAAAAALLLALFISYFNTGAVVQIEAVNQLNNSLTRDTNFPTTAFEGLTFSTSTIDNLFPFTVEDALTSSSTPGPKVILPTKKPTVVTTPAKPKPATPVAPVVVVPPPVPVPVTPKPTPAPTPTPTPAPAPSSSVLGTLKGSIVNILCTSKVSTLHGVSGSGVVIDSRGLILTVTHVAQMLVLEEHLGSDKVSCVIRTGSPAHTAYTARPVYVSEAWLKKNPTTLISSQPTGTGQYDYAVIAINGAGAYAAITPTASVPSVDDTVYLGTYGAQGLTSTEVRNALYPTLTTSDVVRFYTFSSGNGADVIALTGNEAAKQGSSGGAVVNANGRLIGIVTTSDTKGDVADREIRAITIRYIERDFENTTGKSFDSYFSDTSVTTLVNSYAPTVQTLGAFLAHAIGLE